MSNVPASTGRNWHPVDDAVLTKAQIAALNAKVAAADAAVQDGNSRLQAVKTKRHLLETRLAQVPSGASTDVGELEKTMADTLASDPAAALASDKLAAATERRVAARRSVEVNAVQRDTITGAIAKVDEEIAALVAEIEALRAARVQRWTEFLSAAHPFLIDRFRKDFAKLVTDTLQAVVDLQNLTMGDKSEPPLIPPTAWQIRREAILAIERNVPYSWGDAGDMAGTERVAEELFEYSYLPTIRTSSAAIDRFRASLSA